MDCRHCAGSHVCMVARGPEDLEALLRIVRAAVAEGAVVCVANAQKAALNDQPAFGELDLSRPWPDVLQYWFECPACAQRFELTIETYHGSGGVWRRRGEMLAADWSSGV